MTPPVNAELGQVSELFMLLASIAYVVALVFFVLDLVKSSSTIGSLETRLADEQAAPARSLAGVGARGGVARRHRDDVVLVLSLARGACVVGELVGRSRDRVVLRGAGRGLRAGDAGPARGARRRVAHLAGQR